MTEFGEDSTRQILDSFSCPRNTDVEDFLKNPSKAIRYEETGNSRTYLMLADPSADVLAYFSITFKQLIIAGTTLSKTTVRKLDGISKERKEIRAFLIGQIGKNFGIPDNPIRLAHILDEVYSVLAAARALVGGRVVILECDDNPSLIKMYQDHGFTLIETTEQTPYRTLFINIAD